MKRITRFIYVAVAVVVLTIGAVATSADRGGRFASIKGTGAKGDGTIYRYTPNAVRSIIVSGPSQGQHVTVPISHTRTLSNVDYVVGGVCGVGGGSGTITIAGVTGTVTHAYLYWHGINNTGVGAEYNNPIVTINGNSVIGTSLGDAPTNCWGDGSSRAFEADVMAFVTGNGPYTIAGLSSCSGCNANGASLVVVFDDGNPANNRDLVFFTGNDSNFTEGFPGEDDGWHATLPGIAYAGGMVKAIFHAADGQNAPDNSITFSTGGPPLTILDDATLWDGISVPDAGTSRAPNGGLWDIHTFDITAAFGPPGTTTLQLDGQDPVNDCLGLVLMLLDLEPGSAPPTTPTPTPTEPPPSPTATATATEPPPSPTPTATATEPPPSPTPTATATSTPTCPPVAFTNSTTITIPDSGQAIPYPSNINVSGLSGTVVKVTVTINGITHTYTDDVDFLLVGPGGQNATIWSDAGGANGIVNGIVTLDDAAANQLPDATAITPGTYRPANWPAASDGFPAPAPAQSANVALSTFNGTNPNGTWSLYVFDDLGGDQGTISGGWTITITTDSPCETPSPTPTPTATEPPPSPTPTPTPTSTPICQFSTSIRSNFNAFPINAGNYIWFTSVLKPDHLGSTPVTIHFTNQTITSANFSLSVPDATVTFDPNANFATTMFVGGMHMTTVPSDPPLKGNTFFSALSYQVPANLPGGIKNVTWSGTISTDTPGVKVSWKWAAAVYPNPNFSLDYNALGIKPVDDNKKNPYLNADHAGTPENFKSFVLPGATGGGASNYTGGLSGTATVGPCQP